MYTVKFARVRTNPKFVVVTVDNKIVFEYNTREEAQNKADTLNKELQCSTL